VVLQLVHNAVRDKPLINQGHAATGAGNANANASTPTAPNQETHPEGLHGDLLLVIGVWSKQISCIIDVRVCDTDSNSYLSSTLVNILRKQELEKKKKYLQPCLDSSSRDFTPYVLSVDGMLAGIRG
jgi:hypothetical protein